MLAIVLIAVVLFAFQFWMNNVQALPGDFFAAVRCLEDKETTP